MSSLKYWVWLSSVSGVSALTARLLLKRFGTPEKVFFADFAEYKDIEGIKPSDISALEYKNIDPASRILGECEENYHRVITLQDAEYPDRLRNIYDPPIVLYVRGNKLPVIDEEAAIAIVGTRDCTPYGVMAAEQIGYELARYGLLVVTGLARGIDSAAARGALRGGGRVVGILGCGLDVVYPAENKELFEDVSHAGAILSEYPPGTRPVGAHFPVRNRILSGISIGVAIIEAPKNSGALITASRALEQGRDVFAVPGNITAKSREGSNNLLREGAIPLLSGENIATEYAALFPDKIRLGGDKMAALDKRSAERLVAKHQGEGENAPTKKVIDNLPQVEYIDLDKILSELSGEERAVAEAVGMATLHVDEIIISTGLPAPQVQAALTMLELKGFAARGDGQFFSLKESEN